MAGKHQAAAALQKGSLLTIVDRTTPQPGPGEVLIEVKVVALNPIDYLQRDFGMPPVPIYPAVLGWDVAGLVVKAGSGTSDVPPPGSRVLALASSYWEDGLPDYGAFQKYVLAPSQCVTALPETLSFEQGAICPVGASTALSAWTTIGISLDTKYAPEDKQAVLIWGGASSVGTFAIQSAKSMGFTIYTTASTQNHEYLKKLGADHVFDYKACDVVSQVIDTVKKDDVTLRTAHCVVSDSLQPTLDILRATKGDGPAKVAHAPVVPPDAPTLEGVEVKFVLPPMDPVERRNHMYKCFHVWLEGGLASGAVVPSPHIQVETGGLDGLNRALDKLKAGVSAAKIVLHV